MPAGASMSQTVKPDRPIWPPVPETIVPPDTKRTESKDATEDSRRAEHPVAENAAGKALSFEGFGSFAG